MTLWVVKIGTSLLRGRPPPRLMATPAASQGPWTAVTRWCWSPVVPSAGLPEAGLTNRPDTVVALQAAAAIGQGALMALYERAMERHGRSVAQVLLTRSDLADRRRYQNASGTLRSC